MPISIGTFPHRGKKKRFHLPVPPTLDRKLVDIVEIFVRKDGTNGWFVGSLLLFANGHSMPLIGNSNANQFLDNDNAVLMLRDWSTGSFYVAPSTSAQDPLPRAGYRVLGPVLGQVSDTSAVVLYRVDRAGYYRFIAFDTVTNLQVHDETQKIEPNYRFNLIGLLPNRHYKFELIFCSVVLKLQWLMDQDQFIHILLKGLMVNLLLNLVPVSNLKSRQHRDHGRP